MNRTLVILVLACMCLASSIASSFHGRLNGTGNPAAAITASLTMTPSAELTRAAALESFGKLPLHFEVNRGQVDSQAKFIARTPGSTLLLTSNEIVLFLRRPKGAFQEPSPLPDPKRDKDLQKGIRSQTVSAAALRITFQGSNSRAQLVAQDELPGKVNFFIGNDPGNWQTDVPTYAKVRYEGIYPGIDLIYYGNQRQLEYDLVVAPGADPANITFKIEGTDKLELDPQGDLVLHSGAGEVRFGKPYVYQESGGSRHSVTGGYLLKGGNQVGFQVDRYDRTRPLVIDPVLVYSTYLGGTANDQGLGIAVDSSGNAYVTGDTEHFNQLCSVSPGDIACSSPTNFPTANALQASHGGFRDVFVTKLNSTGTALVYSTFIGGSGFDQGNGIAVDTAGNAYVTGTTNSSSFPTTPGAVQPAFSGLTAFVLKLNAAGSALVYSSYLGGSASLGEAGRGIAVDTAGNAYVTGETASLNFPAVNAAQPTNAGGFDAFAVKVNAAGSALIYSTYLGGSSSVGDYGRGIAVDGAGNAYITGRTNSADFPTAGAFQQAFGGGSGCPGTPCFDAFVTKLDSAGAIVYSTYFGGNNDDQAFGIAVDSAGSAYVTGATSSANFPVTSGAFQAPFEFGGAFVAKLDATGSAPAYSAYLGGSSKGFGIAVDAAGSAYVTGAAFHTSGQPIPIVNAFQDTYGGFIADAFVAKLNPAGSTLNYSSYLGGSGDDQGFAIALDVAGNAYLTGRTYSVDFPRTRAFQAVKGDGTVNFWNDVLIAKVSDTAAAVANLAITMTGTPGTVAECDRVSYTIAITNAGPNAASGVIVSDFPDPIARVDSSTTTQGSCTGTAWNTVVCNVGTMDSGSDVSITIGVTMRDTTLEPGYVQSVPDRASVTSDLPDPDFDNNKTEVVTTVTPRTCSIENGGSGLSASGGGCFIATAAYGSSMAGEVSTLRRFRDDYLMKSAAGRGFVRLYYRYSPAVADFIRERDSLRAAARMGLWPVIFVIKHPAPAMSTVLLFAILIIRTRRYEARMQL